MFLELVIIFLLILLFLTRNKCQNYSIGDIKLLKPRKKKCKIKYLNEYSDINSDIINRDNFKKEILKYRKEQEEEAIKQKLIDDEYKKCELSAINGELLNISKQEFEKKNNKQLFELLVAKKSFKSDIIKFISLYNSGKLEDGKIFYDIAEKILDLKKDLKYSNNKEIIQEHINILIKKINIYNKIVRNNNG